jgi:hypothetical protein
MLSTGQHPQLYDPPGSGDHYEQHAQDGGEKQRNPQRQMPVSAEETDVGPLAILQNEDQQQEQHQGEER